MIGIEINADQIKRLGDAVAASGKKLKKELAAAINETAKNHRLRQGRNVRDVVNIKKAQIESKITISKASDVSPQARVFFKSSEREGLQHFAARQNRRGVSYKISTKKGRGTVVGAFMGPRPGQLAPKLHGGVFKRTGSARLPIVKLYGVSPYGAYVKNDFEQIDVAFSADYLKNQIERRINLNVLRASGLVSN
jgi:hypothetical protein